MSSAALHNAAQDQPYLLIVENDQIAARVAINIFEQLNCKVDWVTSGEDAIAQYKQKQGKTPYDLIIMDIGLPKIDGLSATKEIRLYERNIAQIIPTPIIGLSGISEPHFKAKCFEAEMNNIILKPLSLEAAQDILKKYVIARHTEIEDLNNIAAVSGKTLDMNVLFDLIEKNKDHKTMKKIVDEAIESFPQKILELELAHQNRDWQKIYNIALQLSGESAYYGMERLQQACAQVMENIHSTNHSFIEALYEELIKEIILAKNEYDNIKQRLL